MQTIKTPAPIQLPFITVHFLTELSASTIKSVGDVPHVTWQFTNVKTAEVVNFYLRFDVRNLNTQNFDMLRAKNMLEEAIKEAVNEANHILHKEEGSEESYKETFLELSNCSGLAGLAFTKPSDVDTQVMEHTWRVIMRVNADERNINAGEQSGHRFSTYRNQSGEAVRCLHIDLGNSVALSVFKPETDLVISKKHATRKAILMGDAGYAYRVYAQLWQDNTSYEALKFVPHEELLRGVEKGVKELFTGLLDDVEVGKIVGLGRDN